MGFLKREYVLLISWLSAAIFLVTGDSWFSALPGSFSLAAVSGGLLLVIFLSAFAVVRHADGLAAQLGEPYGTLILTLSVISIEVMMISAVMLTGADNPTLARDTMFAVVMLVMNGMLGVTLVVGGLRFHEQEHNLKGSNAFLGVIITLSVLVLVLPNYTKSTDSPTLSPAQGLIFALCSLGLYSVFLAVQTARHRSDFMAPTSGSSVERADVYEEHPGIVLRPIRVHSLLLVGYLIPLVLLSKQLAIPLDHGIDQLGAPPALAGFVLAAIVLSPEALGSVRAALSNKLQRSVNILLGSVAATISLTVVAVLAISFATGKDVVLGLSGVDTVLLILTLSASAVTFASGRTNVLQGAVHIVLFMAYLVLIFD